MCRVKSVNRLVAILACAAATALPSGAGAQNVIKPFLGGLIAARVSLGCRIEIEKLLIVTNTTAGTIAAGTEVFVDFVLIPTQAHRIESYRVAALLPGASFREGYDRSFSCTAWYNQEPLLAPIR